MSTQLPKYSKCTNSGRLSQGEILSGLVHIRQLVDSIGSDVGPILDEITHPYAIILTQDCDLESDFGRGESDRQIGMSLPSVLFCEATILTSLRSNLPLGTHIWKRITQNKDERYQCLEAVPADVDSIGDGTEALGIDFKRYFTIPTIEVYKRVELLQVKRRCRLVTPYAEQLSTRFFNFQARIALPAEHVILPERSPGG